ncbi:MAG: methionine--tRNA ligase [Candidatus Daviesbacteria bacterium]|nr:methionine--tRNA ligase [Candidatus Daviesbacteria bacterium]
MNKFYITTAIPYVNGKPHIGHALEYFQADCVRRYHDLLGEETLLLSGADENALKNVQAAEKEGMPVQEFLDKNSEIFKETFAKLGIKLDVFQRGSDKEKHYPGVQKFWQLCQESGDIYKKTYSGLYCIGCESFKAEGELVDGLCPDHQKAPEKVEEENYFFRLSKYQERLVELIESNQLKITPENKRQETLHFIKSGLEDFSVSRSKERARGVGVPVPEDPDQVVYVWFDALNIYNTGVGFGVDEDKWHKWWPADLHIIGKDINRFHTVYWPAMLLSANLPLPKQVLIHSFILTDGQKMSKTLGNVIDPFEMVESYGLEPFRYYLLSQIPIDEDGDFTVERFKEVFISNLSNGLGNLVGRVAKLAENNNQSAPTHPTEFDPEMTKHLDVYKFNEALSYIWKEISKADKYVNDNKPWELDSDQAKPILEELIKKIQHIAFNLQPFLPETALKILKQFSGQIKAEPPLFPRI